MSRHGRHVPPAFYSRFTRDAAAFAERRAAGRIVSVLEGGYADRALASGALAHVVGLAAPAPLPGEDSWWALENLAKARLFISTPKTIADGGVVQMEKASVRKGRKTSQGRPEPWLERAVSVFNAIDVKPPAPAPAPSAVPTPTRVLRERPPRSAAASPPASKGKAKATTTAMAPLGHESDSPLTDLSASEGEQPAVAAVVAKKLPRVILHVRPPPPPGA